MRQLGLAIAEPEPERIESCATAGRHVCEGPPEFYGCSGFDEVDFFGWGMEWLTRGDWVTARGCLSSFQWWLQHG